MPLKLLYVTMSAPSTFTDLTNRIREDLRLLTLLSESLSLLDMVVNSFGNLVSTKPDKSYVRPEFTGEMQGML